MPNVWGKTKYDPWAGESYGASYGTPKMTTNAPPNPQLPGQGGGTTPVSGGQPPAGKWGNNWNRFELWQPQGGMGAMQGIAWNPDFKVDIPTADTGTAEGNAAVQSANFLNWFNQVMPMLSPKDLVNYEQSVMMSARGNEAATSYFRGVFDAAANAKMGQWNTTTNYNDRDKLKEVLRATLGYSTVANPQGTNLNESEYWAQDIIDLLTGLVGGGGANPGETVQGVWSQDRPMSRKERQDFWDRANTYLSTHPATGSNADPFATILLSLLSPTTDNPLLTSAIGAPSAATRGTSRSYSSGNSSYY